MTFRSVMWIVRAMTPWSCKIYGHEYETYKINASVAGTEHEQSCLQCGRKKTILAKFARLNSSYDRVKEKLIVLFLGALFLVSFLMVSLLIALKPASATSRHVEDPRGREITIRQARSGDKVWVDTGRGSKVCRFRSKSGTTIYLSCGKFRVHDIITVRRK